MVDPNGDATPDAAQRRTRLAAWLTLGCWSALVALTWFICALIFPAAAKAMDEHGLEGLLLPDLVRALSRTLSLPVALLAWVIGSFGAWAAGRKGGLRVTGAALALSALWFALMIIAVAQPLIIAAQRD